MACASPEALIAAIASNTQSMRVGSGGVMLPHYSPLEVAETFGMLDGLFPGRIDLRLGRAAGTDPATAFVPTGPLDFTGDGAGGGSGGPGTGHGGGGPGGLPFTGVAYVDRLVWGGTALVLSGLVLVVAGWRRRRAG